MVRGVVVSCDGESCGCEVWWWYVGVAVSGVVVRGVMMRYVRTYIFLPPAFTQVCTHTSTHKIYTRVVIQYNLLSKYIRTLKSKPNLYWLK